MFIILVFGLLPWIYAIAWGITPLFKRQRFVLDGYLTSCTFDYINHDWATRICQLCLVVGGFLAPFTITIVFYASTLRELRKRNDALNRDKQNGKCLLDDSKENSNTFHFLSRERNNLKIILIYLIIYCLTWTPYAIMSVYAQFGYDIHRIITPYTILPASLITKLSFVYSPIVFSIVNVQARKWCWSCWERILKSI